MRNIWLEGIIGVVVGDALGLPVEFCHREELEEHPVEYMMDSVDYEYPKGTWSDDSSMTIATLDSMCVKKVVDFEDIMKRFVRWEANGEYTPFGQAFGMGCTCTEAIYDYLENNNHMTCGRNDEWSNGNGSLMRIMPACLYTYIKQENEEISMQEAMEQIHNVSALTHNHMRSKVGCGIYYLMVKEILSGSGSLFERLQKAMDNAVFFYQRDRETIRELAHYYRLFNLTDFCKINESNILSGGYVVDTLESVVLSLLTTNTFKTATLRAVNLGTDSDSIGAITGGLAALYYGYDSIPEEWINTVVRKDYIIEMCMTANKHFCRDDNLLLKN